MTDIVTLFDNTQATNLSGENTLTKPIIKNPLEVSMNDAFSGFVEISTGTSGFGDNDMYTKNIGTNAQNMKIGQMDKNSTMAPSIGGGW